MAAAATSKRISLGLVSRCAELYTKIRRQRCEETKTSRKQTAHFSIQGCFTRWDGSAAATTPRRGPHSYICSLFINESRRPLQRGWRFRSSYITPRIRAQRLLRPRVPFGDGRCLETGRSVWRAGRVCTSSSLRTSPLSVLLLNRRSAVSRSTRSLRRQAAEWLQTGGVSLDTFRPLANQMSHSSGRRGNGGRMERPVSMNC